MAEGRREVNMRAHTLAAETTQVLKRCSGRTSDDLQTTLFELSGIPVSMSLDDLYGELTVALAIDPDVMPQVDEAVARAVARQVVEAWRAGPGVRRSLERTLARILDDAREPFHSFERFAADPWSATIGEAFADSLARTLVNRSDAREALMAALEPRNHDRNVGSHGDVGSVVESFGSDAAGWEGGEYDEEAFAEAPRSVDVEAPDTPDFPPERTAYPLLRPGGVNPDDDFAIMTGRTFPLEIGIAPWLDASLAATGGLGGIRLGVPITVQLAYDPQSFAVTGSLPLVLMPTESDPYPVATVDVTPLPLGASIVENRRIAAHYVIDGSLRGIAVREFREAGAPAPTSRTNPSRLDLGPLAGEEPPDVIVAIYHADVLTPGSYFIAVFPRDLDEQLPPVGRIPLDESTLTAVTDLYATAERASEPYARYLELRGHARGIGAAVPAPVRAALKRIAESAPADRPATMLLLTDDAVVPWELASFPNGDRLRSKAGGDAPWLGAHFAIGRWPLATNTGRSRRPEPGPIEVRQTALVTADYAGSVGGWKPLEGALREVAALAKSYPPAEVWRPLRMELLEKLTSEVDVVHFALHGKYDPRNVEDGLVFIDGPEGKRRATYLGSTMLAGRIDEDPPLLPHRPFVFLNACQVGKARKNLGNYSGLAAVFLDAGARGVVACTWNIDDGVAGSISSEFYAEADRGVPAAELIRRVRARYVVSNDATKETAASATLIAYQFYGHPNLRVLHHR